MMHDGLGCLTGSPADFNRPDFGSIRNTATLPPGMLAQRSQALSELLIVGPSGTESAPAG